MDARTDDGDTPLIQAVRWGNGACLELLLAGGANPNRRAMDGRTALDLAEDRDEGDPERAAIIARLIAAGGRRRP